MTLNEIKERAAKNHSGGCNCAQSVAEAFAEELGCDAGEMLRVSICYGGGGGDHCGECGALCGARMALGMALTANGAAPPRQLAAGCAVRLREEFRGRTGAVMCGDIKGRETGVALCSCPDCVRNAVEILWEILKELRG